MLLLLTTRTSWSYGLQRGCLPNRGRESIEPMALKITVNGKSWDVTATPDTPLLYVLSNDLRLQGPRFGCGLAQCGSCSVLVDGVEKRSCVTPVSGVEGKP